MKQAQLNFSYMFQNGSTSKITLNGHFSPSFTLQRGCRQGDPISPYLFILCSEFLTLALNKNKDLEGIKILDKEHKLCQYADDTSIFMRATQKNLKICLDILQWFYRISGLKINVKKTKVIRIGNIRETDRRFCKENNLDWVTTFVSLGISYDVLDMNNITETNIEQKLPSLLKLIQNWSSRSITPIGRITVCKSLLLSKITHILLSLPSPSTKTFDKIEKLLINFIWKNKRHEVSKEILYRSLNKGGLNMINLRQFEITLKLTWLRTFLKGTPDWSEFAYECHIDRLLQTGINYHNILSKRTKNQFWQSVINSYKTFHLNMEKVSTHDTELTPIWGNPHINAIFNISLFNANIRYLQDLYRGNTRLTLDELKNISGVKLPFTHFHSLWTSIPNGWKQYMESRKIYHNVVYPLNLMYILKDKKGTKSLRDIMNKSSPNNSTGQTKWIEELALGTETNWQKIYILPKTCNVNARIRFFQYQVLHRSLLTNRKLFLFNLIDSEKCDNCDMVETVTHLLIDCDNLKNLWGGIEEWINHNINENVSFEKRSILLGNPENSVLVNYIFLVVKHEIYKSKWNKSKLSLALIIEKLKYYLKIEEYINVISVGREKTLGKWSPIYHTIKRWVTLLTVKVIYTHIYVYRLYTNVLSTAVYLYLLVE